MSFRLRSVVCLAICTAVLLTLLSVAVSRARMSARMMSSGNNLRQMGLAVLNYHDTYGQIPLGTTGHSIPEAHHGHLIRLLTYMEASPLYSMVDFDFPWDHGLNRHVFRSAIASYQRPGVDRQFTAEGFAVTHYMANPRLIHRQSAVSLDRLQVAADEIWLFGEVAGDYAPWGYPFGWRELSWPIGGDSGGYGGWPQGAQFVMVDGTVRLVSTTTDRQVVEQMARVGREVSAPLVELPEQTFQVDGRAPQAAMGYPSGSESQRPSKLRGGTMIYFDATGATETIHITASSSGSNPLGLDLDVTVERYPQARVLVLAGLPLTDRVATSISRLHDLEVLAVDSWLLTAEGAELLANLPRLEILSIPRQAVADDAREDLLDRFAHLAIHWK